MTIRTLLTILFLSLISNTGYTQDVIDLLSKELESIENQKHLETLDKELETLKMPNTKQAQSKKSAVFKILDKINAKSFLITVQSEQIYQLQDLQIRLLVCLVPSAKEKDLQKAFVIVANNDKLLFSRWLFNNFHKISEFKHKIYDILLMECK